jgi:hypothetical protein
MLGKRCEVVGGPRGGCGADQYPGSCPTLTLHWAWRKGPPDDLLLTALTLHSSADPLRLDRFVRCTPNNRPGATVMPPATLDTALTN